MNPDQALVRSFARGSAHSPIPITTNPLASALNLMLAEAHAQSGRVVLHCAPPPLFMQGAGVLQGGALSAMVDFAMAYAAMCVLSEAEAPVTTTLEVAFLRPAPAGRYEAIGEIIRKGKTILFARAELRRQGQSDLIVSAASTLSIIHHARNAQSAADAPQS